MPISLLDKMPVFKGCDATLNNEELIKCTNTVLKIYVQKNFRDDVLVNDLGLSPRINSIFLFFNIDKTGAIVFTKVTAAHLMLRAEGIRLIKSLPNALSQGYLDGKLVTTPNFLPVRFVVEDDTINEQKKKH